MSDDIKGASAPSNAVARGRMADDFLKAFSELEHGMENLKTRLAEADEADQRLVQRAVELDARARELEQRHEQIASEQKVLAESAESIGAERRALESAKAAFSAEQSQLEVLRNELEGQRREVAAQRDSLQQDRVALGQLVEQHEARERELKALQQSLDERSAQVGRELEQARGREREISAKLDAANGQLAALRTELADVQAEVALMAEAREASEARAQSLEQQLEATRTIADQAIENGVGLTRAHERATAELKAQLGVLGDRLKETNTRLAEAQKSEQAARQELERVKLATKRRDSDADALTIELASVRRSLTERQDEVEALKAELTAREAEIAQVRARLEEAGRASSADVAVHAERIAELSRQLADANAERDRTQETCARLEAQLRGVTQEMERQKADASGAREAETAEVRDLSERLEQAQAELERVGGEAERLRDELVSARAQAEDATAKCRSLEQDCHGFHAEVRTLKEAVTARETAIEKLYAQCEELERRCEALQSEERAGELAAQSVGLGQGISAAPADERTLRRRARLRRARVLVKDQSQKVRLASEALRARFEQCDQVLAMRGEVIEIKKTVVEAQRRLQKQRAGSRVAAIVCYGLFSLLLLCGLGYGIAQQVAPGVFAARATLKADGAGRELSTDEKTEWTKYHEKLFSDPQLMEEAAGRMKRRGIETLATPAELTSFLASSLTHESPEPGTINVELRAPGSERAVRVLETFLTAMSSQSNATRNTRVDGAVTTLAAPPTAGSAPIDNQRLVYAGVIAGGGFVLTFAGAGALWVRLANARQKFEGEARVDAVLESAAWSPPELMKKPAKEAPKDQPGFKDL